MDPYNHIGRSGNVALLFLGYLLIGTSSTKNLKNVYKDFDKNYMVGWELVEVRTHIFTTVLSIKKCLFFQ